MIASPPSTMTPALGSRTRAPALTTEADRALAGALADLAAAIERAAADLGLAEEPSGFRAALEAGAPRPEPAPAPPDPPRG